MGLKNLAAWAFRLYLRYSCKDGLLRSGAGIVAIGCACFSPLPGWFLSLTVDSKGLSVISAVVGPENAGYTGLVLVLLGAGLMVWRRHQLDKKLSTLLLYLKGYDNMEEYFPNDSVPATHLHGKTISLRYNVLNKSARDALGLIQRIPEEIARLVESNGAAAVKIIFAGRAFVPLQYAAGRVLGTRPEFELMEFDRETGRWHFLDELDDGERINLIDPANAERVKESRQAALVLPFTANISIEQLPEGLRDVAYRFELESGPRQDSMASREKMEAILKTVNQFIRNLRAEVDVLHVFAAVSTSTAVRLGCLFQNNIYPETRVYQFDTCTGGYPWALRLLADKMEIIEGRPEVQSLVAVG